MSCCPSLSSHPESDNIRFNRSGLPILVAMLLTIRVAKRHKVSSAIRIYSLGGYCLTNEDDSVQNTAASFQSVIYCEYLFVLL